MKARLVDFLKSPFWSPAGFILRAAILALIYGILSLCGLRDYTTILSGGLPTPDASPGPASFLGVVYVLVYFLWIIGVPILLIGAALFYGLQRITMRKRDRPEVT